MKFKETFTPAIEKIKKSPKILALLMALGVAQESRSQTVEKVDIGDGTEVAGDASTMAFVKDFVALAQTDAQAIETLDSEYSKLSTERAEDSLAYREACSAIADYIGQAQEFFETTKSRERSETLLAQFSLEKAEHEMQEFFDLYTGTQRGATVDAKKLAQLFKTYITHTSGVEDIERAYTILSTAYSEGSEFAQKTEKKILRGKGGASLDASEDMAPPSPQWIRPESLDALVETYFSMLTARETMQDIDMEKDMHESSLNWLKQVFRDAGLEVKDTDASIAESK